MSLEIEKKFGQSFARHSSNMNAWQVSSKEIVGYFNKWLPLWVGENKGNELAKEYESSERPDRNLIERLIFKFFSSVKKNTHVHIPKESKIDAVAEYFED